MKHIAYILLAATLSGCYTEFSPEISTEPVLCLNSLITAGEPISVDVTHTTRYTEGWNPDCKVDDAVITVYADGRECPDGYLPREGDHIKIHVHSDRYGDAEAEVSVPVAVEPGEITVHGHVEEAGIWDNTWPGALEKIAYMRFNLVLDIPLRDRAATVDYYHYGAVDYHGGGSGDDGEMPGPYFSLGELDTETEPIFSEHIDAFESAMGSSAYGFTFFSDRQFQGDVYTLHPSYRGSYFSIYFTDEEELKEDAAYDWGIDVQISVISPSYYNWLNYVWQSDMGFIGDLTEIGFADPIWGYSNVSTGAGVVAARAVSNRRVPLKEFLKSGLQGSYPAGVID